VQRTTVRLHVWGDRACFTRPEMKVERVSYDVITPSAARGIIEAVHWHPQIRWVIDRIEVLKPIQFTSIRRNEVGCTIPAGAVSRAMNVRSVEGLAINVDDNRQQRAGVILRDVAYVIEAHFEQTPRWDDKRDSIEKHLNMFLRRARQGQCFHQPSFGIREFTAYFRLANGSTPTPIAETRDLGMMLLDMDFKPRTDEPAIYNSTPKFFRARMINGVIDVPLMNDPQVRQ
jgi:CRISPR-associated protein Cas5d